MAEIKQLGAFRDFFSSKYKFNVLVGGSGCVSGSTKIETLNGLIPIKRFRGGLVASWRDGARCYSYATPPKQYPKAPLFRVILENGFTIDCTARHRLLTDQGWRELRAILPSSHVLIDASFRIPRGSTWGTCLSTLCVNVRYLTGIVRDFLTGYSAYCRRYGVQLHSGEDTDQGFAPLQGDARGHSQTYLQKDGRLSLLERIRSCLLSHRPSKSDSTLAGRYAEADRRYYTYGIPFAHSWHFGLKPHRFRAMKNHHAPLYESSLQCPDPKQLASKHLPIKSITYIGGGQYYDITCPENNCYIAHGMIHHNSGKSYAAADDVILRTIQQYQTRYIVARKVAKTMRASVFDLLINRIAAMGLSSVFVVNKTEMSFRCKNGNDIILVGLDDVNKLKSIYDPTDAWIEEADQTTQADLEEIERRIRTVTGRPAKITLTLNPTSAFSWIKSYFFDNPDAHNVYTLKTTYRDNPLLDPSYHEAMERLKERNPSAYRVYGLGEWGVVEGVVFEQWDIADVPDGAKFMGYGLDFGYTNDPTTLIGCWTLGDHLYLDESLYRTGLTNPDISAMFSALGVKKADEIIADSAEPKSIEELHRAGWYIKPAIKGPDSIRLGIDTLKRYVIHLTPRSSNLQREFSSYTWSQDKDGKWRQEPIDMFNHGIDAARYRVAYGGRKGELYKGKVPGRLVGRGYGYSRA